MRFVDGLLVSPPAQSAGLFTNRCTNPTGISQRQTRLNLWFSFAPVTLSTCRTRRPLTSLAYCISFSFDQKMRKEICFFVVVVVHRHHFSSRRLRINFTFQLVFGRMQSLVMVIDFVGI
ncbi:hypothetical protein T4E_8686 [Trichinella pseudospiralis]|uniref:Uncharacterized protein n=1 Tax=Trichinella pseudospiralis TaxID=6337 RepID=A0A0V0XX76_TRIPS|nr:hypothetical protein T4E_10753 [Trichinella pseudospiralis]KRX92427.1 hypothetical protein T4E_8686 [Trichinella pseudospiralis]